MHCNINFQPPCQGKYCTVTVMSKCSQRPSLPICIKKNPMSYHISHTLCTLQTRYANLLCLACSCHKLRQTTYNRKYQLQRTTHKLYCSITQIASPRLLLYLYHNLFVDKKYEQANRRLGIQTKYTAHLTLTAQRFFSYLNKQNGAQSKFLLITNLTHFFMNFFSSLYMFRRSQCSSSGDRIVLIYHLV